MSIRLGDVYRIYSSVDIDGVQANGSSDLVTKTLNWLISLEAKSTVHSVVCFEYDLATGQ